MASAGNAVIGALSVVLGVDTATLETGLKSASLKLGAFAGVGVAFGQAFTKAVGGALGDVASIIPKTIDGFDKLSKTSQKIGVSVETLSALQHAANLSDVSFEGLQKSAGKLARSLVEAAQGSQTPLRAFEALGISIRNTDGSIKTVSQALPELADRFSKMRDGPEKTALAIQLLGRAGADLIPLLNSGSAGLKQMTEEAKQLGLVISTDTGKTAEAFNDNLTRLQAGFRGIAVQLTQNILPTLAQLSQFLIDSFKNSGFLQTAANGLTAAFNVLARTVIVLYDNFVPLAKLFALWVGSGLLVSLGSAAISLGLAFVKLTAVTRTLGLTLAAFEAIRSISTRGLLLIAGIVALAAGAFDNFGEKIRSLGDWISQVLPEGTGAAAAKILSDLGLNLEGLTKDLKSWKNESGKGGGLFDPNIIKTSKDAIDSFIASTEKHIATQLADAQAVGMAAGAKERLRIAAEALSIAQTNNIPITDAMRARLDALGLSAEQAALKLQGAQLIQQSLPIQQQYQMALENTRLALIAVGATADQTQNAIDALNQKFQNSSENIMQGFGSIAGSLSSLTGTFAKENKAMGVASKAFGIAQAIINTQVAITKALATLPPPASYVAVAAAVAQGAASIAAIAAQKFATGGAIRIGGSGGRDSQLVQIMASPDEQIDIWRPGEGPDPRRGAGGRGGGGNVNIYIPRDAVQINRGYIEQLIPALNDAIGDGHRIKLVPA